MTREIRKTIVFVAVALLLSGAAFVTIPDRTGLHSTFNDQGKKFFPDLNDPHAVTSLEVIDYDPNTATPLPFKVTFKDGKWIIPSHHDYTADARDRLSKTAGAVFDLVKETIRSDAADDHEKLGVVDPLDTKASSLKGQGKRVTLRDASDKVLADFIIGREIKDHPGQRYVRVPGINRTYGVTVGADLTTKFGDWIETNLLKIDSSKIRRIVWDKTKVDPERGVVITGETFTIERKDANSPWVVPNLDIPPGQEIDSTKINGMITALSDLKIVGVRTKPPGLSRELKVIGEGSISLKQTDLASLRARGFYPTRGGQLLSNQGDMKVETEDGAVYTLRFGEASFATGEALSAGEGDDEPKPQEKPKAGEAKSASGDENRFVLVTIEFNPKLVLPPEASSKPVELPKDPFLRQPGSPEYEAQQKEIEEARAKKEKERSEQLAAEQKKVQALSDRFAPWYYVTPGASFRSLALAKTDLIHPIPPPAPPGRNPAEGMPSFGGGGGFPGLPQGHP